MPLVDAEPYEFAFEPAAAALLIIDMQRDFPRARRGSASRAATM